ncbi:MAG: hypothetical protein EBU83_01680, partial [bacterium]|nr:hypothetical protein [Candidatus Aquidulcis sp.]
VGMPGRKVVSINGDGGFAYNVMELATMVEQKIPLTAIVFNDNAYGNVKRIQQMRFGGRTIVSDLHNPDMMKLADAYGVEGRRAQSPAELKSTLVDVFKRDEPVLIEVPVGPMPIVNFKTRREHRSKVWWHRTLDFKANHTAEATLTQTRFNCLE